MVALIDAARAAREEAQRLRHDSTELRFAARAGARRSRTRLSTAAESATVTGARRPNLFATPWSPLQWRREDAELERALVPVD